MQLSEHFSLEELCKSASASRLHLDNTPGQEELVNLTVLCVNTLEPLRKAWGDSIIVSSGYRSPKVNKAVGGVANSQHLTGQAADILPRNRKDAQKLFALALKQGNFDQALLEFNKSDGSLRCIHISCKRFPAENRVTYNSKYMFDA